MLLALLLTLQAYAADPQWLALLHYSGAHSSIAKGSSFFLSPAGHDNPDAELAATKDYFRAEPEEAACRYPARAIYLHAPESHCERFVRWREALRAKSAELVFAAAFIASPSSMYGHTLIKFPRSGQSEGEDLLDYTLNYGANTGSTVGLPYVFLGLTGGFNGSYATAPFYLKVREYNFVENRDFWIYPLKLDEHELHLLAAHAWELRDVAFPYFFLHKNCAYYVLELLEVARPGSRFTAEFPGWTVPADTIRLLKERGIVGEPRFRASRYRRLKALREQLNGDERSAVERLAETGEGPLTPGREPLELEAAYELWRYRNESKRADTSVEAKLLTARAHYDVPPFRAEFPDVLPPEKGHPTARVHAGYGVDRRHGFVELGYKGKLHDLLADPAGFEDYSELSMGDLRAREEDGQFYLERADVLRLRSIAPAERWIPRAAWSFRGGFERAKEFDCTAWACSAGELEGGYGMATSLGPVVGYALGQLGFEVGKPFDRHYRLGAGPLAGFYTPLWKGARALVEGEWRWRLLGSQTPKRAADAGLAQTFSPDWEARATFEVTRGYREGLLQANFYF